MVLLGELLAFGNAFSLITKWHSGEVPLSACPVHPLLCEHPLLADDKGN